MSHNLELDNEYVRQQFPAFEDRLSKKLMFFENAGGSYVPQTVVNKLNQFMIKTKVQPYGDFELSKIAGEQMDEGIRVFAEMINADFNEVIIGNSTTMNMYVLSRALSSHIKPGDEIIVTNQDHEANIGAWRNLSKIGAVIKEWKINLDNSELEIEDLQKLLSPKTKIVAVTHTSNIVGSNNNIKEIAKIVHKNNSLIVADGVSYAPHGLPDVKDLDVDFYTFSLYKTFGPHLGLLYGKYDILKSLPNQNHEFVKDELPNTVLNPGGSNHELTACLVGVGEYFDNLYHHHFSEDLSNRRHKINLINKLMNVYENKLGNTLIEFLLTKKNVKIIGKKECKNKDRAPTISFIIKNKSSKEICDSLIRDNIGIRNGNFYAWRCLNALGIEQEDGVIRASIVHYNNINEVELLIKSLDKLI